VGADGPDEEHMVIGTVESGFDTKRQRNIQRAVKQIPEECKRCALAPRCANWCPCANLALTGEIGKPGGLLCFHEQLSVKWADHAASTLFAEKNPAFMMRFYS
jgi:radical SAM protein with 4Fe4S-binding SPASM domain